MGYKRLYYISSTRNGKQYIDTGVKPSSNTRVVCCFLNLEYRSLETVLGSYYYNSESDNSAFLIHASDYDKTIAVYCGNGEFSHSVDNFNYSHTVDLSYKSVVIDGSDKGNTDYVSDINYNIYLFADNSPEIYYGHVGIVYCKIYDGDTLIRNYIPVLSDNNEAGMYDTINGTFQKSQSETPFNYTAEYGDVIDEKGLVPVEYIAADGYQAIATISDVTNYTKVVCDFEYMGENTENGVSVLFGGLSPDVETGYYFGVDHENSKFFGYAGTLLYLQLNSYDVNRHIISLSATEILFDGVNVGGNSNIQFHLPHMYLFGMPNYAISNFAYYSKAKMYSCKIYEGDILMADYKPYIYDGVAGLYNSVDKTFYPSCTNVPFIAGPEVSKVLDFESQPFGFRRRLLIFAEPNNDVKPEIGFNAAWSIQSGAWTEGITPVSVDSKIFTSVSPGDNGSTVLRCTFSGCVAITFRCISQGENNYDYLTVGYLDSPCTRSSFQYTLREERGVVKYYTYMCDRNEHYVEFCYSKDSSDSVDPDAAAVYISEVVQI